MMEFRRGKTDPLPNPQRGRSAVAVLLSEAELASAELPPAPLAGFDVRLVAISNMGTVPDRSSVAWASAIVVEVGGKAAASWERLERIVKAMAPVPVIAALREPTHAETRQCLHLGTVDAIALPLNMDELSSALVQARQHMAAAAPAGDRHGKIIAFVKSVGGVGATAMATQMGCLLAQRDHAAGHETCLIDLDVQFGNAALYLGLAPELSVADLIAAGARVDGALLRSTTTQHKSGLLLVAAPPEILPLESVSADQMGDIIGIATHEFSHILLDLPGSWTNWSLSLVARADAVCLVTEMSIPSLRQARRQLDMLADQGFGNLPVYVIVNRHERGFMKSIRMAEVEQALGRMVAAAISNDFRTLSLAIDQGVPVGEIHAHTRLERDMTAAIEMLVNFIEQRE